jgi:hypothetical protein
MHGLVALALLSFVLECIHDGVEIRALLVCLL